KKFSMGIELADALRNLIQLYGENDKKYALKKLEAYELLQKVVMNIDKATAQKSLLRQKYEEDLKINEARFKLEEQLKEEKNSADKHKQQLILTGVSIILLIVIIFSFFIFKALKENQKKNKIILEQNVKVEKQKQLIEEKHKDITDSINYAQKIQTALIISEKTLSAKVENVFVMFKPRDVVSGDFYWYTEKNGYKLLAVADCTGHGVPGAFMSMIGITLLNQIVREKGITSPSKILNELRDGIISSLNQTKEEASERDGMDVSLIAWNKQELIYAGANNPCVVFSNKEIIELKPDKQPVGLYEKQESFNEQKLDIKTVESIYLFTDGIVDQFGGENGKKIKIKLFKEWLKDIAGSDSRTQKTKLEKKFTDWKMNHTQTDDILVIGIKA
ncbi:MAG TPA: SpoIIE family protein phosphatase, partial [Bacteroidia bacterium]|nr:SpoIIE family protein phosphatase [Bacteroidia bacterium]